MLEFIRRKSTSFLSWIILGGIALVFGLQFGLPSDSLTLGPDGLAEVHGEEIRREDFEFQFRFASQFGNLIPESAEGRQQLGVNEEIIDSIVERTLLAHEARKMGLAATETEAEDMILDGHLLLFGKRVEFLRPDEKYSPSLLNARMLMPLGDKKSLKLVEHQREELLAEALRDLMTASVLVPESEVRREYEAAANTLSLRYARYEFAEFATLADPTPAQLDAYVAEHAEELEQRYESQKTRFTALPKQARLQLVQAAEAPEAREALEQARAAVAAGGQTLAAVARAQSTHDTAARGGDYGWVDEESQAASDLPEAVRQAVPGLETGAVSEVLAADGSLWLLRVTDRREGDVPKEAALRELAEEGVRDELGQTLARRAAEEDQKAVAAGTPLLEVFAQPGALGETTLFGGTPIEALPVEGETPKEGAGDPADDAAAGLARPKAELRSTGPLPKTEDSVPNLGRVPGLLGDAWDYEGEAELLDGIYQVPGAVVVAGVESKQQATDEGYAEQRPAIMDRLRRAKARAVVAAWAQRRCFDAKGRGDIKVSEETVKRYTTYDAEPEPEAEGEAEADAEADAKPKFTVCDRVGTGMLPMLLGR